MEERRLGVKGTRLPCGGSVSVSVCVCGEKEATWHHVWKFEGLYLYSSICLSFFCCLCFFLASVWVLTLRATSSYIYSNLNTQQTHVHLPSDTPWTQRSKTMFSLSLSLCLQHAHTGTWCLFTFCNTLGRTVSTFGLHPSGGTENPLVGLKSLTEPQYRLARVSIPPSHWFYFLLRSTTQPLRCISAALGAFDYLRNNPDYLSLALKTKNS